MTTATDDKYACYPIDEPQGRILLVAPDVDAREGGPDRLELSHCADGTKSSNWSDTDVVCPLTDDEDEARQIFAWVEQAGLAYHGRFTGRRNQDHAALLCSLVSKAESCFGWTFSASDKALVDKVVSKYGALTKDNAGDRVLSVREAVEYMDKHIGGFDEHSTYQHFIGEGKLRRLLHRGHWPMTRTADGHMGITVRDVRKPFRAKPLHPKPLSPRMQARLDRDREHARAFHAAQEAAGLAWNGTAWVRAELAKSA